ncbi:MAG: DUF805 domain-containing protein [Planctomycetes bacterium]|nr:DUF805 domain-containing protein [Planctomycetota bacterium]MBL7040473.1 DUF805 domain-containing protein [Pirellulaceae bacterium]
MSWTCKKCRTKVDDAFDVCWQCGTSVDGIEDESFSAEADATPDRDPEPSTSEAARVRRVPSAGSFSYIEVWKKFAVFEGRASRIEFWMFFLFNVVIALGLSLVDVIAGTTTESGRGVLSGVFSLAVWLPNIAVTVRRLHDTGRSGWWLLIGVVPCVGAIVLFLFLVQASEWGYDQYGSNLAGGPTRQQRRKKERQKRWRSGE